MVGHQIGGSTEAAGAEKVDMGKFRHAGGVEVAHGDRPKNRNDHRPALSRLSTTRESRSAEALSRYVARGGGEAAQREQRYRAPKLIPLGARAAASASIIKHG